MIGRWRSSRWTWTTCQSESTTSSSRRPYSLTTTSSSSTPRRTTSLGSALAEARLSSGAATPRSREPRSFRSSRWVGSRQMSSPRRSMRLSMWRHPTIPLSQLLSLMRLTSLTIWCWRTAAKITSASLLAPATTRTDLPRVFNTQATSLIGLLRPLFLWQQWMSSLRLPSMRLSSTLSLRSLALPETRRTSTWRRPSLPGGLAGRPPLLGTTKMVKLCYFKISAALTITTITIRRGRASSSSRSLSIASPMKRDSRLGRAKRRLSKNQVKFRKQCHLLS